MLRIVPEHWTPRHMQKFWKRITGRGEPGSTADQAAPQTELPEVPVAPSPAEPVEAQLEPSPVPEPPEAEPAPAKRGWRERLSGSGFARNLGALFVRHPKLDDDLLDELETTLLTADVGIAATQELVEDLRRRMHKREFADANALLDALRAALVALLEPVAQPLDVRARTPFVLLIVGVNGVGKTTT
ncbi:MAG TPA: signal recognition particle receptor subunit alpha, partial [Rhodanobacteraceae bacterium]|nr:signal recognition particle receptor subunit alpha [Rhodanobacteraceae bacterium]